jgi:DNA-binding MarR family transcriptional regulator
MTADKPSTQTFLPTAPGTDDPLPDHLFRWLEAVNRRLSADLAHARLQFPELRRSQRRILSMIPPAGARITDLARLADMTKQSLGEVIDGLEQTGFVASRRSATDGRVRIVSRTESGDDAVATTQQAIEFVERRWRAEIGAARYDAMKDALRELGRDALRI